METNLDIEEVLPLSLDERLEVIRNSDVVTRIVTLDDFVSFYADYIKWVRTQTVISTVHPINMLLDVRNFICQFRAPNTMAAIDQAIRDVSGRNIIMSEELNKTLIEISTIFSKEGKA